MTKNTNAVNSNVSKEVFAGWLSSITTLKTMGSKEVEVMSKNGKHGYTHKVIGLVNIEGDFPSLDLVTMDVESGKLWQFDTAEFGALNLETGIVPSKSGYALKIKFPAKKTPAKAKATPKANAATKAALEKKEAEHKAKVEADKIAAEKLPVAK